MTTIVIERRICLEPKYLDSNVRSHLLKKVYEQTKDECTEENGHLLEIKDLKKIVSNRISPATSDIVFTIQFEAIMLKPEKGKKLSGTVCMVFQAGVFIEVMGILKVLIPITSMPGYKLNKTGSVFTKGLKRIKEGDIVTVCISEVTYKDKEFSSFGSIFEDA